MGLIGATAMMEEHSLDLFALTVRSVRGGRKSIKLGCLDLQPVQGFDASPVWRCAAHS